MDRSSSVDIATYYGMEGLEIETQRGARFSPLVQNGPGAHPRSCTMGTGTFPGVRRPERDVNHPASCTMGTGTFPGVRRPGRGVNYPASCAIGTGKFP